MSDTTRTQETLAKHRLTGFDQDTGDLICGCGSTLAATEPANWPGYYLPHLTHLAAMLAPLFAEARAEGANEALTQAAEHLAPNGMVWHGDNGVLISRTPYEVLGRLPLTVWLHARAVGIQ